MRLLVRFTTEYAQLDVGSYEAQPTLLKEGRRDMPTLDVSVLSLLLSVDLGPDRGGTGGTQERAQVLRAVSNWCAVPA